MECANIYGVDINKEVDPIMVRDAIITCFIEAHKEVLEQMKEYSEFKSDKEFEEMKKINIKQLVRKMFEEIGADYAKPTKAALEGVIVKLKEFAGNFRKPDIVHKHATAILSLISKLE